MKFENFMNKLIESEGITTGSSPEEYARFNKKYQAVLNYYLAGQCTLDELKSVVYIIKKYWSK